MHQDLREYVTQKNPVWVCILSTHTVLHVEPSVTQNILNISHIPAKNVEISARAAQRVSTDTAPTAYTMQHTTQYF
jgi:hypothetical protein